MKGEIQQSELRAMKSSSRFEQTPAAGESMVPTGDMTGVKEPFRLAVVSVQCVEGRWSPHQHNILNKGREEGETEVKLHALGHMVSKWQNPAKHRELLYSHC